MKRCQLALSLILCLWASAIVHAGEVKGNKVPVVSIKDHITALPLQQGDNVLSVIVKAGSQAWKLYVG